MPTRAATDACAVAGPEPTELNLKAKEGQSTGRSAVVSAIIGDLHSEVAQVTNASLAEESERRKEPQVPELQS